jgi:hypothetical protein
MSYQAITRGREGPEILIRRQILPPEHYRPMGRDVGSIYENWED